MVVGGLSTHQESGTMLALTLRVFKKDLEFRSGNSDYKMEMMAQSD